MTERANERFNTTPVGRAIAGCNFEATKSFQAEGLDLSETISGSDQWNALHIALVAVSSKFDPAFVAFLIGEGADVAAPDRNNMTPLHYAARAQQPDAIRLLVEAGAPVNVESNDKRYPLPLAMETLPPCPECVEVLLAAGACQHTPEWRGWLRKYAARRFRRPEHAFMLEMFDRYVPEE